MTRAEQIALEEYEILNSNRPYDAVRDAILRRNAMQRKETDLCQWDKAGCRKHGIVDEKELERVVLNMAATTKAWAEILDLEICVEYEGDALVDDVLDELTPYIPLGIRCKVTRLNS